MTTAMQRRTSHQQAPEPYIPQYELRARNHGAGDNEMEVWQLSSPATPQVRSPRRLAGLRGRNLSLVERRLLKHLRRQGVNAVGLLPGDQRRFDISEDEALRLGLLFRMLAPMRSLAYMESCVLGVEAMAKEEAAYWLGMVMYRKNPRRVLMALRILLTNPSLR